MVAKGYKEKKSLLKSNIYMFIEITKKHITYYRLKLYTVLFVCLRSILIVAVTLLRLYFCLA